MISLCLLGWGGGLPGRAAGSDEGRFRVIPEFQVLQAEMGAEPEPLGIFKAIFDTRFELPGHDVRGVTPGPDGRLYFFCGGGGAALTRPEGGVLRVPEEGAVLRCEADGSHLELFCRGLREPHGLAFDNAGNLFAGDAGSGQDEGGRWLYLTEHGDYGWRVGWPHSALGPVRNPWVAEKLWAARFEGQAAWILPPVMNLPVGSWGIAHYPGTGFSERYYDHFFVGNPTQRTISSWVTKPNGAGFLLFDKQEVVGDAPARDVVFGRKTGLYFGTQEKGAGEERPAAHFALSPTRDIPDPQAEFVGRLLSEEWKQKGAVEWAQLLKSPDQRVRLAAEWSLVASTDGEYLLRQAALSPTGGPEPSIARVHGIWGWGILARRANEKSPGAGAKMLEPLVPLLEDDDLEVRAQAARVLGEQRVGGAFESLVKALRNPDERVSMLAAEALGKLGRAEMLSQLILMVREAGDHDPNLRHAYVEALRGLHDDAAIEQMARQESPTVRLVALLALREMRRAEIARFLCDDELPLVLEAARAIHDEGIAEALPQLAALIEKPSADEGLMVRVLNANFRVGQPANATALATFAAREDTADVLRVDALKLLALWAHPPAHDYVTGATQTLAERDAGPARDALSEVLPGLRTTKSPEVAAALGAATAALLRGQ